MRAHPRIRKRVKWGGAVASVALLVLWIGSEPWYAGYSGTGWIVTVQAGGVWLGYERSEILTTQVRRRVLLKG